MKFFMIIGLLIGMAVLTSCGNRKFDSCVNKGVAYFKEIGSYPTLHTYPNTGRHAKTVATERCRRSIIAFDGW
ncbi:hypothetical protein [Candidatus Spongiihabitans sp.]|uniref:hypothetical protein n=1 Tax=Candidatus Spongiihabitans sp. TaxID=3101308 RepID=UPI003C70139D